jgi:hypothetical protein
LEVHLKPIKRDHNLVIWKDRELLPGASFDDEIRAQLDQADIIILLASPDFIASDYCHDVEMARALERHKAGECCIITVVLEPCQWQHTPLGKFVALPTDGRPVSDWPTPNAAYHDTALAIRRAVEDMIHQRGASPPMDHPSPIPIPSPSTRAPAVPAQPRPATRTNIGGLNLPRKFTQADRDQFQDEAFETIASFFDASLQSAASSDRNITVRFRRVDINSFTAVLYIDGNAEARCRIWNGGSGGGASFSGICFSHDPNSTNNSMNEQMTIETSGNELRLKAMGMASLGSKYQHPMAPEEAGQYFWNVFTQRLQARR